MDVNHRRLRLHKTKERVGEGGAGYDDVMLKLAYPVFCSILRSPLHSRSPHAVHVSVCTVTICHSFMRSLLRPLNTSPNNIRKTNKNRAMHAYAITKLCKVRASRNKHRSPRRKKAQSIADKNRVGLIDNQT